MCWDGAYECNVNSEGSAMSRLPILKRDEYVFSSGYPRLEWNARRIQPYNVKCIGCIHALCDVDSTDECKH